MKVVILCGGLGMRLREETEYKPKPMVEIGGRPILWHIMKIYGHYGFREFVLCLGYKGKMIKEYFLNYNAMNNDFRIKIGKDGNNEIFADDAENFDLILSDTGYDTMTGGRLKKVEKYISDETFMLTYGDGISDINIRELIEFHHVHGKIGTVTGVVPSSRFGELSLEGDRVIDFSEKPTSCHSFVSGGFFVFNRKFFSYLNDDPQLVLEKEPLEKLALDGELMVYRNCKFWHCMDTARDRDAISKLWESGNPPWKVWED
jgi:glucose-1-phosphate cytidylyltransferase